MKRVAQDETALANMCLGRNSPDSRKNRFSPMSTFVDPARRQSSFAGTPAGVSRLREAIPRDELTTSTYGAHV